MSGVELPPSGSQFLQQCGLGMVIFQTRSASVPLMKRKAGQISGVKFNSSGGRGRTAGTPPSAWLISPAPGDSRTHFLRKYSLGAQGHNPPFSLDLSVLNQSPMMTARAAHQSALPSQTELKHTLGGGCAQACLGCSTESDILTSFTPPLALYRFSALPPPPRVPKNENET